MNSNSSKIEYTKRTHRLNLWALLILILFNFAHIEGQVYPIQFSLSESKIIGSLPKDRDFASIIPGNPKTYIYAEEGDYINDYRRSYYGITCKKAGWDCLRHYEILASGCIPYFIDLEKCDPNIMPFLPKDLILEAMHLPGVSYMKIDHSQFDIERYYELLTQIIDHTQKYLSSAAMAKYLLEKVNYKGSGKILFLSANTAPDYLPICTLIGLKEYLGDRVIDFPKIDYIYKNYRGNTKKLYGKGFSYTRVIPDIWVNRKSIQQRIRNHEFDIIIYGSVHRGVPFHQLVKNSYEEDEIIYLCGEDEHSCEYVNLPHLFLREW